MRWKFLLAIIFIVLQLGDVLGDDPNVMNIQDILAQASNQMQDRVGEIAHEIFCDADLDLIEGIPSLHSSVKKQCRSTMCNPICLDMAWTPYLEVHCERAPNWSWCPEFANQVKRAESAITAQFQGHICLQLHLCNRTEGFIDWIENISYDQFPKHRLPIDMCKADELILKQSGRLEAPNRPSLQEVEEQLCSACEQVIDVRIDRGACTAESLGAVANDHPRSLPARCKYVADVIGNHEAELTREFRRRVCPCLGCCGEKECYFPDVHKKWLSELTYSVQDDIRKRLANEGWISMDTLF